MRVFAPILQKFSGFGYLKLGIVVGIAAAVIAGTILYKNSRSLCDKCNVILVSLDTLSALHLPCYGYGKNTAPNLCAYAKKNVLFSNSYSQASRTLDSHFSIFTSLYPHTHKMTQVNSGSLDEKYITLAQLFRGNGYQTIYNGPLNDLHLPLNRGIERGFDVIEGGAGSSVDNWETTYAKLLDNAGNKRPTFTFLHTYDVHNPYLTGHAGKHLFTDLGENPNIPLTQSEYNKVSPEFISFAISFILDNDLGGDNEKQFNPDVQIAQKMKQAGSEQEAEKLFSTLSVQIKVASFNSWYVYNAYNLLTADPKQVEYLRALYDEQIYNMDQKLRGLFALMEDPRLAKNTILIITADHGEEFMEHGSLTHGDNIYRTSTQVPLIIHIPGMAPKVVKEMVQGIDIYPTAISLTGFSAKSPLEGINLSGLIKGDINAVKNKYLISEISGGTSDIALQDQNYRFYYSARDKSPQKLYDLAADPEEKKNLLYYSRGKVNEYLKIISLVRGLIN